MSNGILLFDEQGVDMFGGRVGFLKFKADVIDKETGKKVLIAIKEVYFLILDMWL